MPRQRTNYLTISQAAERLGLATDTLRPLQNAGLIDAERSPGGHRRFSPEAIEAFRRSHRSVPSHQLVQRYPRPTRTAHTPALIPSEPDDFWDDWDEDFVDEPLRAPRQPQAPIPPAPAPPGVESRAPAVEATPAAPAARDDPTRLEAIKRHAAAWIPFNLPADARANVIEEVEGFVTAERFPAWTRDWEAQRLARERVEEVVKRHRDEQAAESTRQSKVAGLIEHGVSYARRETSDGWEYSPAQDARRTVQRELKARIKPDWTERQVEKLVDHVLDDWEDDEDEEWDEED